VWVNKHAPKSLEEIEGQDEAVSKILEWMKGSRKGLLAYGPPGTGKTATAYLIAKKFDLEIVEMNASDFRKKADIQERLMGAALQASLFGKGKLILIDEVDGISPRKDFGAAGAIAEVLERSRYPVFLTCNDNWAKQILPLKKYLIEVEFRKPRTSEIVKRLEKILELEKVNVDRSVLLHIANERDFRSAISDLQMTCAGKTRAGIESIGERDRSRSIFEALRDVFKTRNVKTARDAVNNLDNDIDEFMLWVDENIQREYSGPDVSKAHDALSRADVFRGRILRRQDWSLLRHVIDLSTAGVAMAKKSASHSFVGYRPPEFLQMMGRTRFARAGMNEILQKIGNMTHSSRRRSREYLPVISAMMKKGSLPFEIEDKQKSLLN
jgi:replication factor C large subunit